MGIVLRDARRSLDDRAWLGNVYPFYLHDLSPFDNGYYQLDEHGRWQPDHLPAWLADDQDVPLLIVLDGRRVGFAFVGRKPSPWVAPDCDQRMSEFFVLRRERGHGVGGRAARAVFDAYTGRWEVTELKRNVRAIRFWRRVIAEHTGGRHAESSDAEEIRQTFSLPPRTAARRGVR